MRHIIRTENDLSVFVNSLKTLTLGQMAGMFNKTLKHPEAKACVDRAIGNKAKNTISDRQARELAADLLGFENVHVMAAHFKGSDQVPMYQPWNVVFEYKGDNTSHMIAVPKDIHPSDLSVMELSAAIGADYNPFSGHDYVNLFDAFGEPVTLEEAYKHCDGVVKKPGMTLTFLREMCDVGNGEDMDVLLKDLCHGAFVGTEVELNMGSIEACDSNFEEELLALPQAEQATLLLRELEVSEAAEKAFAELGLDADQRFACSEGAEEVIVDFHRGYAGRRVDGDLVSAILFSRGAKK